LAKAHYLIASVARLLSFKKNLPGSQKSSRKFTANPNPWPE
jgi:hypothetical protein